MTGEQTSVREFLASGRRSFSFEFFPPKDADGERVLWESVDRLAALDPTFVSVTYGAGGTTRDRTAQVTARLTRSTPLTALAHLTCVGASREELRDVVTQFTDGGVRNLLALRGDPPGGPGKPWVAHPSGLNHAIELVELIREAGEYSIGVAASTQPHPESNDLDQDARVLVAKARAGADFAVTQLFFEVEEYLALVDRVSRHGSDLPILAGILPITRFNQVERFAAMSGVPVPAWLVGRLEAVKDDSDAVRAIGMDAATTLVGQLLDAGAPGIHLYTLNRSAAAVEIFENLGLTAGALR